MCIWRTQKVVGEQEMRWERKRDQAGDTGLTLRSSNFGRKGALDFSAGLSIASLPNASWCTLGNIIPVTNLQYLCFECDTVLIPWYRERAIGQVVVDRLSHPTPLMSYSWDHLWYRARASWWFYTRTTWKSSCRRESSRVELRWIAQSSLLLCQPLESKACLPCCCE